MLDRVPSCTGKHWLGMISRVARGLFPISLLAFSGMYATRFLFNRRTTGPFTVASQMDKITCAVPLTCHLPPVRTGCARQNPGSARWRGTAAALFGRG
jgi:hypothetical protein